MSRTTLAAGRRDASTRPAHGSIRFAVSRKLVCWVLLLIVTGSGLGLGLWGAELHSEPAGNAATRSASAKVSALILQLDHPRPAVRREAAMRLAEYGAAAGPAIPKLMGLLQDADPLVRAHAARAACRIGLAPGPVVPILARLLDPQRPQSCCLAALILGDLGSAARGALPALKVCLETQEDVVRLHAAEAVLKIDAADYEALDELLSAIEDEQNAVRYFAANALGSAALDDDLAVVALERALTDTDTNVAAAAAVNLSKRDDRTQGLPAPESADDERSPSTDVVRLISELSHAAATVRRKAAIHLGLKGRAAVIAVPTLRERLADPDLVVRVHAARALWAIEPDAEDILPVLVDLLGVDRPNVTVAATQTLGKMGEAASAALPTLRDVLETSEFLDRLVLADAITRIDPKEHETLRVLTTGLRDPEGDVRYLAAVALGTSRLANSRRIVKELRPALHDRNLRVQSAARYAIQRLSARTFAAGSHCEAASRTAPGAPGLRTASLITVQPTADFSVQLAAAAQAADEARIAARLAAQAAAEARAAVRGRSAAEGATGTDDEDSEIPALSDVELAQADSTAGPASENVHDEGLKPISELRASIRVPAGDLPEDVAAARIAAAGAQYHGYGARRGWSTVAFGWDAPAMYFQPLYFQDVNLERYGRHFCLMQPFVSWGMFYTDCLFLPYKLVTQPPCECKYTLGYERPNNCVPLQCCLPGYPSLSKLSLNPWRAARCTCPTGPANPWNSCEEE